MPLTNYHPITQMTLLAGPMVVWVADSFGYVTIWDALVFLHFVLFSYYFILILSVLLSKSCTNTSMQTLQKCHRLQIHQFNCVQSMTKMNGIVWMAVARDLIAVHSMVTPPSIFSFLLFADFLYVLFFICRPWKDWSTNWPMTIGFTTS